MPMPVVEPRPRPSRLSRRSPPLDAQEASYLAASASTVSLRISSIGAPLADTGCPSSHCAEVTLVRASGGDLGAGVARLVRRLLAGVFARHGGGLWPFSHVTRPAASFFTSFRAKAPLRACHPALPAHASTARRLPWHRPRGSGQGAMRGAPRSTAAWGPDRRSGFDNRLGLGCSTTASRRRAAGVPSPPQAARTAGESARQCRPPLVRPARCPAAGAKPPTSANPGPARRPTQGSPLDH